MKMMVWQKNHVLVYSLIILLAVGLVSYNLIYSHAESTVANMTISRQTPVYCVENHNNQIAITFDCAWEDTDTDEIIKVLEKHQAKATFFVVGEWVDRCAESVKKLHRAGHEIMNHSDEHTYPTNQSAQELLYDIESCNQKIKALTGIKPTLYRAPAGDYNSAVVETVRGAGYQMVQWSVDSLDWKDLSAEQIYQRVIEQTASGDILLFHLGKANTPAALDKILGALSDKGYTFVPVSQLVLKKHYRIDAGGKQHPIYAVNK